MKLPCSWLQCSRCALCCRWRSAGHHRCRAGGLDPSSSSAWPESKTLSLGTEASLLRLWPGEGQREREGILDYCTAVHCESHFVLISDSVTVSNVFYDSTECVWDYMLSVFRPLPAEITDQYICAGNAAEPQVLNGSLLKLHVSVAELAVWAQDVLDGGLHFWKQVNELDVGRQQQCPRRHRTQVELGVEKVKLDQRAEGEDDKTVTIKLLILQVSSMLIENVIIL